MFSPAERRFVKAVMNLDPRNLNQIYTPQYQRILQERTHSKMGKAYSDFKLYQKALKKQGNRKVLKEVKI